MLRRLASTLGLVAVVCSADSFAIRNVRVFDGERVIPRTTVIVTGDAITAIAPDAEIPAGAQMIDGNGKTLLPGLIDAHTHTVDPKV